MLDLENIKEFIKTETDKVIDMYKYFDFGGHLTNDDINTIIEELTYMLEDHKYDEDYLVIAYGVDVPVKNYPVFKYYNIVDGNKETAEIESVTFSEYTSAYYIDYDIESLPAVYIKYENISEHVEDFVDYIDNNYDNSVFNSFIDYFNNFIDYAGECISKLGKIGETAYDMLREYYNYENDDYYKDDDDDDYISDDW